MKEKLIKKQLIIFVLVLSIFVVQAFAFDYWPRCEDTGKTYEGPCGYISKHTLEEGGCSQPENHYYLYGSQPTGYIDGCSSGTDYDYYCDGRSFDAKHTTNITDEDGDGYDIQCDPDCDDDVTDDPEGCPQNPNECNEATKACAICIHPGATEFDDDIDQNCANDAPVFKSPIGPSIDIFENSQLISLGDISGRAFDTDGNSLNFSIIAEKEAEVNCTMIGTIFKFVPAPGFKGPASCTVQADDNHGKTTTDIVYFTVTALPDTTAPATVTNLANQSAGKTWIYWGWTNPSDADFSQAIVYINSSNVANTSNNYYNATGLTANTSYTIIIHTKDTSGNVNNMDVNSTASTLAVVANKPPNTTLNYPPINYYNDSSDPVAITFNCSATDDYGLVNISLYITNNQNTSFALNKTTGVSGTTNETTWTLSLINGNYTWNCRAYDSNGLDDWAENRTILINYSAAAPIDNPPTVNQITPPPNYYNDTSDPANIFFNCSATDDNNVTNISLYITNNQNTSFAFNSSCDINSASGSCGWTLGLSNGNYTWNCLAYDNASNQDWGENRTILINYSTAPAVDNPPNVTLISPDSITIYNIDGNVTFSYSVTDENVTNCTLYTNISGWQPNQTDSDGTYDTFFLTGLSDGAYEWNVLCYDNESKPDWGDINFTFTMNTSTTNNPPQITSQSPTTPYSISVLDNVTFNITVEDPEGANMTVDWYVNSTPSETDLNVENGSSANFTYTFTSEGLFNVTAVVKDDLLQQDNHTWLINVTQPIAPGTATSGNIVINEIMYKPTSNEWIEIYNAEEFDINLSNWKFYEASTNHGLTLINGSEVLPAGEYAIIADDIPTFLANYPDFNATLFDASWGTFNDDGECLALKNASTGAIIDEVCYNSSWGGNSNISLELINVSWDNNISTSWGSSLINGGTPGFVNTLTFSPFGNLTGIVNDSDNNIYKASIKLLQGASVIELIETDANGAYSFVNISIGDYNISITKVGYNDHVNELTIAGGTNTYNATLTPASFAGSIAGTVLNGTDGITAIVTNVSIINADTLDVIQIVPTDATGNYTILGLPPTVGFTYSINATIVAPYTTVFPRTGINLNSGENKQGQNIYMIP